MSPDPKYNNEELARFINRVMQRGKKTTAQRITYSAFNTIRDQSNLDPLEVFQQAVRNATPMVEGKAEAGWGGDLPSTNGVAPGAQRSLGHAVVDQGSQIS